VEGNIGFLVGNYGRKDVSAMINVPIQEGQSAFRLAAKFTETDGFYENTFNGKSEDIGGQERFTVMPSFQFEQENWNVTARGSYSRYRDDATVLVPLNYCGEDPRVNPGSLQNDLFVRLVATSNAPGAGPEAAYKSCAKKPSSSAFKVNQDRDLAVGSEMEIWGVKIEYNYSFDDLGTLTYVAGYQDTEEHGAIDSDSGPLTILHNEEKIGHWQNSHEIRFASEFSSNFDMVVGALWMQQEYDLRRKNFPSLDSAFSGQKNEQYAFFAHTEWHLTDKLTLIGAGRYSVDEKDFSICPSGQTGCIGNPIKDSEKWTDFSPRLGVNYQFTTTCLAMPMLPVRSELEAIMEKQGASRQPDPMIRKRIRPMR